MGFGPFRWVCTSGNPRDLAVTDNIAASVLEEIGASVTDRIRQQYNDNIRWIREAGKHKMVGLRRMEKSIPCKCVDWIRKVVEQSILMCLLPYKCTLFNFIFDFTS